MRIVPYTIAILSTLIGASSIGAFTLFLYMGPPHVLNLSLTGMQVLLFDLGLCLLFFIQHSLMVRKGCKDLISRWIPPLYFGAVFAVVSSIMLISLMLLWQESPLSLWSATDLSRWSLRALFFFGLVGQAWATLSLKSVDIFGSGVLMGRNPSSDPIMSTGAYRWIRHPIYFTSLILFWSYPDLTADRILLNSLFTLWIVIGTILEERDLVAMHGEQYLAYQRAVPMLVPFWKSGRGG